MIAALQPANDGLHPRSRPTSRNKLALIDAAWVCHHLPELAHLTQADKAILCALIRHIDQGALDGGKSTVFPSTLCLALDTGYTQRQVMRSLARMEARQLISRFTPPRWRTAHTDLSGFMALAADVLDAHAEEKDRQLRALRRGPIAVLVDDTESSSDDTESPPTETDIEPAIPVQQSDATRSQLRRRPDKPAAANRTDLHPTSASTNRKAQDCSPSRAGFSAGAESGPSVPAEMPRAALVAAWEASPTFRRLVDVTQLQAASLEQLAAAVERDYLATVTGIRNPHHIWAWAVNRHGLANTVLGWLIACDTPPSADRPERNPGGWFTRFATAERPWNLARNLRQLACAPRPAPASPVERATRCAAAPPPDSEDEAAELNAEAAAATLAAYRTAWIRTLSQQIGPFRAEAIWKTWLSQAAVIGIEDDRLQIRVHGKATPGHLFEKFDDVCRIAAQAVGYEGADFTNGTANR
ncbi:MAG: hypothetical protein ACRC67_16510 [Inquilinus sp.]|uniref:hypothetical protein n=1 Tax=Inquilinus sp. TaxID=1932117 RepID=UPI003F34D183